MKKSFVACCLALAASSMLISDLAFAGRYDVRREYREGVREVSRERREARREIRRCKSRECARREMREGYREVNRERREARREIRREIREDRRDRYWRDRDDDNSGSFLGGLAVGAIAVGVAAAIANADDE